MGRAAVLLFSPSSSHLCCSLPATNGPVSCTCKAEECDASLHTTRGWRTGCACSQVITCHVCEHATQLLHLHLASSCHSSSSRDQQTSLPFRRRHTHNAAPFALACDGEALAHCHPSQAPSNEALAPHTLPWTHAFFHEVRVAHWMHGPTSHSFVLHRSLTAPLHGSLLRSVCHPNHHHHEQQQQRMRLRPLLARATALPPVGGDCCYCVVLFCTTSLDCSSSSC